MTSGAYRHASILDSGQDGAYTELPAVISLHIVHRTSCAFISGPYGDTKYTGLTQLDIFTFAFRLEYI